jgi:hypothetical protein
MALKNGAIKIMKTNKKNLALVFGAIGIFFSG